MGPSRVIDVLAAGETALWVFMLAIISLRLYSKYISPRMNLPPSTPTLPAVKVTVARFPANGHAPSLERLHTTTKSLIVEGDPFPAHIPDIFGFWNLPPTKILYRDWETTQLKNQPVDQWNGIYLTIYTFDDSLQENLYTPDAFKTSSRMFGDVFVAKLAWGHCGKHGRAVYEDINPTFLRLPCVTGRQNPT